MSKVTMDGIFVNGQQAVFHPENILSGDASTYTEEIGTAVETWMEENVTGGEQVTDTTLTLPGVPADAKETGDQISAVKEDFNDINELEGVSTSFGADWSFSPTSGQIGIVKNRNYFTLSGTASGSNRYTLLSADARKMSNTFTGFDSTDYTLVLKANTRYRFVVELKSGAYITAAADRVPIIIIKASGDETPKATIYLKAFSNSSVLLGEFTTGSADGNYAIFVREISTVTYSGAYMIYLQELPKLTVSEIAHDLTNQENLENIDITYIPNWEIGSIRSQTGEDIASDTRIKTDFIDVSKYESITISIDNGYKFGINYYDSSKGKYVVENAAAWYTAPFTFKVIKNFKYVRIVVADISDGKVRDDYTQYITITATTKLQAAVLRSEKLLGEENAIASTKGYSLGGNTTQYLPAFVHVTDLHGDATRFDRAMKFAKRIGASGVFGTGDFVNYLTSASVFQFVIDAVEKYGIPFYPCSGNHEQISNTQAEVSSIIFQPLQEQAGYTLASVTNPTYWHKDLTDIGIRLIAVNQFEDSSSQWIYDMSQAQADWLCSTINSTPADYGIVILEHCAETSIVRTEAVEKFCQQATQNPYKIGTIVSDVVDAYISGTTLSKTYEPQDPAATSGAVTINYDFSTKNSGTEFIAFVSGHYHRDLVHYESGRTNTMLNLNLCSSAQNKAESLDLARVDDTDTQDAFNVYVFDRERKVVKIVRIGSHLNYNFSTDRNYLELPYLPTT